MALTVEDGTGRTDAEAYISVSEFKQFAGRRGYNYDEYGDPDIEASIRLATDWIDTYNRYKGTRLRSQQAKEFPRADLTDWSDYVVTGVPQRVKDACAELAFKGLSESLYLDQDRGGKVQSESVGPISVSYAADAPTGKVWTYAQNLLKQYLRDPNSILGPLWTEPAMPSQFSVGMNDLPDVDQRLD